MYYIKFIYNNRLLLFLYFMCEYLKAFRDSFPIAISYFIVSIVFGITCISYGLPVWFPFAMSLFVYSGTSQFLFLTLFTNGASVITIILATSIINFRYMPMSLYMSDFFDKRKIGKKIRWVYGYNITDETFAFKSILDKDNNLSQRYFVLFNLICHIFWALGSLFGSVLIKLSDNIIKIKLQYSLTAMLIYIVVLLAKDKVKIIVAIFSVIFTIVFSLIHKSNLNIFLSTFLSCLLGLWLKKKY